MFVQVRPHAPNKFTMEQKKRGRKIKSFKDKIHPLTIYVKGEVIEKNGGEQGLRAKIEKELKK